MRNRHKPENSVSKKHVLPLHLHHFCIVRCLPFRGAADMRRVRSMQKQVCMHLYMTNPT